MAHDRNILYGKNVVREVLCAGRHKAYQVYWGRKEKDESFREIQFLCRQNSTPFSEASFHDLERMTGSREHQGVAVETEPFRYTELDTIIQSARKNSKGGFIILLDEIQDPHNVGAIIRTAHCLGADGMVLLKHRQAPITPAVCKAAAGAEEYLPIAIEPNLSNVIRLLKTVAFTIYGAAGEGGSNIFNEKISFPAGLVMGSEGKGLRKLVGENCDLLLTIPMEGKIDSLNVSVAAGILMGQLLALRQKT